MRANIAVAGLAGLLIAGCVARPSQPNPAPVAGKVCDVKLVRYEPPPTPKTALDAVLPEGTQAGKAADLAGVRIVAINQPGAPAETQYLTLDEAIAKSLCTVRETGTVTRDAQGNEQVTDGDVNRLLVSNTSDKPIFLMAGDLVLGGKQDRILAAGLIVEPGTKDQPVQVFCVEHGRWTAHSGNAGSQAGLFLNSPTQGQADIAVKRAAVGSNDQSQVWQAVATNNSNLGVSTLSLGGSFRATYDSEAIRKKLETLMTEAAPLREGGSVGYAVMVDGEVAVMDLFDSRALCDKLSEKLLRSYLITALSGGYTKGGEHPLTPRLRDKVTAKFEKIKFSEAVAALDDAWDVSLEFQATGRDPIIHYSANDQDMAKVIDSFASLFGMGAYLKDARTVVVYDLKATLNDVEGGSEEWVLGTPAQANTLTAGSSRGPFRMRAANQGMTLNGSFSSRDIEGVPAAAEGVPASATPIEYGCKDAKREKTVHRGYLRR